jgi:hypothetical protein
MAGLDQHRPDALEEALLTPVLKVTMHRAVITELIRQRVLLATGVQAEEDIVRHPPQVHAMLERVERSFGIG